MRQKGHRQRDIGAGERERGRGRVPAGVGGTKEDENSSVILPFALADWSHGWIVKAIGGRA